MKIRQASAKDSTVIAAIWNVAICNSTVTFNSLKKTSQNVTADIDQKAENGLPFLVAEAAGQILGFATYSQFRPGTGYVHSAEHTIYLAKQAQGQGAGRQLLAQLENHARQNGFHVMIAGLAGSNLVGQGFHAALGYTEVGRLPEVGHKFGGWHDLVLMQKIL